MTSAIVPIFIFSLPRSGSTLTQRVLGAHSAISTAAEPWLLLPFVYALREHGIYTEYDHSSGGRGIRDFVAQQPNGKAQYYLAVRQLASNLYQNVTDDGAVYFVDKTPRYHLIVQEILDIFPDAKCVLLWRNPLAVAASLIETWSTHGRWNLYRYNIDLYEGIQNLVDAAQHHRDRFFQLRYEDAVSKPSVVWPALFAYLGLEYEPEVLTTYRTVQFGDGMGDPNKDRKYDRISPEGVRRWTGAFRSPLRRAWARRYLNWIGSERLGVMGYERAAIVEALDSGGGITVPQMVSDAILMALGAAHGPLDLPGIKRRVSAALAGRRWYPIG